MTPSVDTTVSKIPSMTGADDVNANIRDTKDTKHTNKLRSFVIIRRQQPQLVILMVSFALSNVLVDAITKILCAFYRISMSHRVILIYTHNTNI